MNIIEAEEILDIVGKLDDYSCSCHMGNPPCGKCERMPAPEDVEMAKLVIAVCTSFNGEFYMQIRKAIGDHNG